MSDFVVPENWFDANMEVWHEALREHTFRTVFIPLSRDDLVSLERACETKDTAPIAHLCRHIDDAISGFRGRAAIVKTSCRSPKDAANGSEKMRQLCSERVAAVRASRPAPAKPADKAFLNNLIAAELHRSLIDSMRVTTGAEACSLLCASGRVLEDVRLSLQQQARGQLRSIVVREWRDIPARGEFRGFVCDRRLVALSQYFDDLFFEGLTAESPEVALVRKLFDAHISAVLPLDRCIVDFAITADGEALVIELNPSAPTTDPCMFSWVKDEALLVRGQGPFECRVVTKPRPDIRFRVLSEWQHWLVQ